MDETPIRAVELVRSIRDQLYEETKTMSPEEFKAFVTRESRKPLPPARQEEEARPAA
jgi:hypothetical protein